jgi:hypothetical protein
VESKHVIGPAIGNAPKWNSINWLIIHDFWSGKYHPDITNCFFFTPKRLKVAASLLFCAQMANK